MNMTKPARVVITDFIQDDLIPEKEILSGLATVEALNASHESELLGRIEDADAIMLYHELGVSKDTIDRLDHCKLIVRCGVGIDNVDHVAARQRNIAVANVPDYGTEEVADSAIAMSLTLARGVHYLNSVLRAQSGPWHYTQVAPLQRLNQLTFAIVGLGRIGSAAALRAKALGMRVVFYDPYIAQGYDKALGITRCESLDDLLSQANILSLHCPLTEETRHMIDATAMTKMPAASILVNTARGAIIDTAAIPEMISNRHLAGAGIDVLEQEPPDPNDPLVTAWQQPDHLAHHRVIINPHSAFYCEQGLTEMRVKGANACRQALQGLPIANVVN